MSNIILCADDSKIMQTVAEITFRVSDYTYVGAMSADEALQKAREQKPALILADAIMPGKTGYELCKAIKSDPQLADIPVYVMCGNSAAYDAAKGAQARADGYLSKPWDTQVMLDKVAEILDKAPSQGAGQAASPAAKKVAMPPAAFTPPARTATPPAKPPATPARTAPRVPMPPTTLKAPAKAPAPAVAKPPVTPKPPLLPTTPPAAKPVDTQQAVTAARTHTIMGMPTVMPPKTPAEPVAETRPSAPSLKATAQGLSALKPVTPAAPAAPAPPVASKPAASAPPRHGVPAQKGAEPSAPAPRPVAPATPAPLGATPAAARTGINRPPMIKGKPTKRPAFLASPPPPPAANARIAAATSAAVATAARESGLDPEGPEMRALLALSKDVVERVVWEVVPELAETIIRENLDRLAAARR
jgi:CheY-like chemotaxis protein